MKETINRAKAHRVMSKFFCSVMIAMTIVSFAGCHKGSEPRDVEVNINSPQSIQDGLRIDNANKEKGDLPKSTFGNDNLSSSISSIKVDADGTIFLPLIYQGGKTIRMVYIQVVGATGHFSVKPFTSCFGDGTAAYISIKIPTKIDNGNFGVNYLVQDVSGSYSNVVRSLIYVTNDVVDCNTYVEGKQGLTFTMINLGNKSGEVSICYDTYVVPDRIDIYQGKTWITGTGTNPNCPIPPMCYCDDVLPGFIGTEGYRYLSFNYNASKGQVITVVVSGCLDGGTLWEWFVAKSPNCTSYSTMKASDFGKLKEESSIQTLQK